MSFKTEIQEERVALDAIVQRSQLGKHINEAILRPILNSIEYAASQIMEDLGFMIVSELQHRLYTAAEGKTYEVYLVNEGVEKGTEGRYEFIGWYSASAAGGPPLSGPEQEAGLPTGTLAESIWYAVNDDGSLSVTLKSTGTESHYYYTGGGAHSGKIFMAPGGEPLSKLKKKWLFKVEEYFQVLEGTDATPGMRPFWRETMREKEKYWQDWMNKRFQKAVKKATRRPTVSRALKLNIYWKST